MTDNKDYAYLRKRKLLKAALYNDKYDIVPYAEADTIAFGKFIADGGEEWIKENHIISRKAMTVGPKAVLDAVIQRSKDAGDVWNFLVKRKGDAAYIADVGIKILSESKTAEMGCFVAPSYRRQGIQTDLATIRREGLARQSAALGIRAIAVECYSDNVASMKALKKAGFTQTGVRPSSYTVVKLDGTPSSLPEHEVLCFRYDVARGVSAAL